MPRHDDPTLWNAAAADHLRAVADRVAAAPPPTQVGTEVTLAFTELAEKAAAEIDRLTAAIDRDRCLYVFEATSEVELDELRAAFRKAKKERKDEMKLPEDNEQSTSHILNVGSSCATTGRSQTLKSRLKQHLVAANKGTYALNLSLWAADQPGGVVIRAYDYAALAGLDDDAAREVVLAAEDWLSSELQPLFGRRGSRH